LSINVVISLAATPGHHNTAWLTEVARVLRPGGEFWLQEPLMSRDVAPEEKSVSVCPSLDMHWMFSPILFAL
jgi:hypothetical protein